MVESMCIIKIQNAKLDTSDSYHYLLNNHTHIHNMAYYTNQVKVQSLMILVLLTFEKCVSINHIKLQYNLIIMFIFYLLNTESKTVLS